VLIHHWAFREIGSIHETPISLHIFKSLHDPMTVMELQADDDPPRFSGNLNVRSSHLKMGSGGATPKPCNNWVHMGVSKNRGTPKWMVYNGKPY